MMLYAIAIAARYAFRLYQLSRPTLLFIPLNQTKRKTLSVYPVTPYDSSLLAYLVEVPHPTRAEGDGVAAGAIVNLLQGPGGGC